LNKSPADFVFPISPICLCAGLALVIRGRSSNSSNSFGAKTEI
jgi:hypothetical protein